MVNGQLCPLSTLSLALYDGFSLPIFHIDGNFPSMHPSLHIFAKYIHVAYF